MVRLQNLKQEIKSTVSEEYELGYWKNVKITSCFRHFRTIKIPRQGTKFTASSPKFVYDYKFVEWDLDTCEKKSKL